MAFSEYDKEYISDNIKKKSRVGLITQKPGAIILHQQIGQI